MEILSEAEKAAETDIWSLMQFTENLRLQYGKEPYSMEILLKKLYVRRMASDLGISRIFSSGKMVCMETNIKNKIFSLMLDSMTSDIHRNVLKFENDQIKVTTYILISYKLIFTSSISFSFSIILSISRHFWHLGKHNKGFRYMYNSLVVHLLSYYFGMFANEF